MSGADTAQLRALARRFDASASLLGQIGGQMSASLEATRAWQGTDAAAFREIWSSQTSRLLRASQQALIDGSDLLRRNADEQDHASAATGETTSSGSATVSAPPGQSLRPGDPGYHGLTPLQQALAGDYVALGDSYSSGEGAGDYLPGTDDNWSWGPWADDYENMSHRSEHAYSELIDEKYGFAGEFTFAASSGATMDAYWQAYEDTAEHGDRDGEGPQRDHLLGHHPSLVTMTMGGNDFGFTTVLSHAITSGDAYADPGEMQALKDDIHGKIWGRTPDGASTNARALVDLWGAMRADAGPDARLLIGGYPQLFPDHPTHGGDSFISVQEQARLNELADYVNEQMRLAAAQSGADVEFVDLGDALQGHEIGTDDPWINDLDLGRGGPLLTSSSSFHPKAEGQQAMANAFEQQIEQGRR